MILTLLIITIAIMFWAGASSSDQAEGPRTIGQKLCEGVFLLIMSVWGLGAGIVAALGVIALLIAIIARLFK